MAVKEDESTSECLELDTLALADTRVSVFNTYLQV